MGGWVHRFGRGREVGRATSSAAQSSSQTAGYALVDALVALLILALALVFGLRAAGQARMAVDQAREIRRAQTLIAQLMDFGPRTFEAASGQIDQFDWTVETRSTGAAQPVALCHRTVHLTSAATRRTFTAATLETCPIEAPA